MKRCFSKGGQERKEKKREEDRQQLWISIKELKKIKTLRLKTLTIKVLGVTELN